VSEDLTQYTMSAVSLLSFWYLIVYTSKMQVLTFWYILLKCESPLFGILFDNRLKTE